MDIIKINNMQKDYPMGLGKFTALKNITTRFAAGEFTGIVGPSGSGKTTLLNIIGSLDEQTKGDVQVLDHDIKKLNNKQASKLRSEYIGFIFQTYNLLPVYTVFENVEFPLLLIKNLNAEQRKKMVEDALEWLGLSDKRNSRPNQLSGGQCQRVAIARAIVKKPKLVLADEPTANLDAENSHHILGSMQKINQELETTFIFSTHDQKVIRYLQRKITLLDGEIAKDEVMKEGKDDL